MVSSFVSSPGAAPKLAPVYATALPSSTIHKVLIAA
jgi:hypothetical protein